MIVLSILLGQLEGNLALATAAHAIQQKFPPPPSFAAAARAKVCAQPLQDLAPHLEERRDRLAGNG